MLGIFRLQYMWLPVGVFVCVLVLVCCMQDVTLCVCVARDKSHITTKCDANGREGSGSVH